MKGKKKAVTNKKVEDKCFKDLQELLLLAVKLELFTIPIYLYTYYSLRDHELHVRGHLRMVIMEEMLHMAIVSNIMHAIEKCKPPAYSPIRELENHVPYSQKLVEKYVPFYPRSAPIYKSEDDQIKEHRKFVEDAAVLALDGLSREQIVAFLRLELPELGENTFAEDWKTISEFYNFVKKQLLRCPNLKFHSLDQVELHTHNPTKGRSPMRPIQSLKDSLESIDFIVEQGEGATFFNLIKHHENYCHYRDKYHNLKNTDGENEVENEGEKPELAHFYQFLVIYGLMGGKEEFSIDTESFDEEKFVRNFAVEEYNLFRAENVINLVKNPAREINRYPDGALKANKRFNSNYSNLLDRLTYASLDDHRLNFGIALEQMTQFDKLAKAVTEFTLKDDETTYCGPTFEYVHPNERT